MTERSNRVMQYRQSTQTEHVLQFRKVMQDEHDGPIRPNDRFAQLPLNKQPLDC